jgi:hypothetical protein
MFDVVRGTLAVPQHTVVQWLDLPPERRARWIGQADIKASAALLLLEEAAQRRAELQARSALKRRWLSGRGRSRRRRCGPCSTKKAGRAPGRTGRWRLRLAAGG